ncbi:MAG TPA: hypothetical protein VGA80_07415 [Flavobacteriaceae bacterium]|jgi:hypothetical protein
MNLLENLKLNRWYGVVLYLGVLLIVASLYFEIDFVQKKHLFGLGIGMILIGLAHLMSEKYLTKFDYGGYFTIPINKHNAISRILIFFGIGLVGLFGFLIVKDLI